MDNQYEEEISLVALLFKTCQKWRTLLIVALAAAVVVGGTRLAMNIQTINDPDTKEELLAEYRDALGSYEVEGESLKRSIDENQRKLQLQSDYNEKSMLMKLDCQNVWKGSINLYIDTGYQVMPGSSIQNENPAYKITYAYYDYYNGEFYTDVMGRLSFDIGEVSYLKEVLLVSFDDNRYSVAIEVTADTRVHCDEMLRAAGEAFQAKYDFVKSALGEHSLTISDAASNVQISADWEQYQIEQKSIEHELEQSIYSLNEEYRQWKKKRDAIEAPITDWKSAVKDGIKWVLIAAILGGSFCFFILIVQYMISGRIKSAEDLGYGVFILAELPAQGKKKNAIDRGIYRLFGVMIKTSEYDSRAEAMSLSVEKMLRSMQCEKGTIAFVGDVKESEIKTFVKLVGKTLPDAYTVMSAGNIIAEPAAARIAYDADAVVLVATQDVTMKKTYEQVCSKLAACKVKVLGAVLFGVESV